MKIWKVTVTHPAPKDKRRAHWKSVYVIHEDTAESAVEYLRNKTVYLEIIGKEGPPKVEVKEFTDQLIRSDILRIL